MSEAVKRDKPEPLYFRNPDCSICGNEVSHDGDSLYCEQCNAYWPDDTEGAWVNYDVEQCSSTHQPLARNKFADGKPYQFEVKHCLLDAGHGGKHRVDMITEWTDESAITGEGPS